MSRFRQTIFFRTTSASTPCPDSSVKYFRHQTSITSHDPCPPPHFLPRHPTFPRHIAQPPPAECLWRSSGLDRLDERITRSDKGSEDLYAGRLCSAPPPVLLKTDSSRVLLWHMALRSVTPVVARVDSFIDQPHTVPKHRSPKVLIQGLESSDFRLPSSFFGFSASYNLLIQPVFLLA